MTTLALALTPPGITGPLLLFILGQIKHGRIRVPARTPLRSSLLRGRVDVDECAAISVSTGPPGARVFLLRARRAMSGRRSSGVGILTSCWGRHGSAGCRRRGRPRARWLVIEGEGALRNKCQSIGTTLLRLHDTQQIRACDLLQPQVGGSGTTYKQVLGRGGRLPSKARHCIGN